MLVVNDVLHHRVFVRPHVNKWPAFSKSFTLETVLEMMRFR